jgi:hypothetical protein
MCAMIEKLRILPWSMAPRRWYSGSSSSPGVLTELGGSTWTFAAT